MYVYIYIYIYNNSYNSNNDDNHHNHNSWLAPELAGQALRLQGQGSFSSTEHLRTNRLLLAPNIQSPEIKKPKHKHTWHDNNENKEAKQMKQTPPRAEVLHELVHAARGRVGAEPSCDGTARRTHKDYVK